MPGRGRGRNRPKPGRRDRRFHDSRPQRGQKGGNDARDQRTARDVVDEMLKGELGYRGFRPTIEGEAREAAGWAERESGPRRDLTALATFTVDPATARDFDDAVSAQHEGDGARVWIHIADVAAHVRPGSLLDQEARRRGNSTYVPGAVEPMLPHALSSEACSLAPGVERLAVTTEVELGPGMQPRRARFYRSRIRSDVRLELRPARRDLWRPGAAAGRGSRTARRRAGDRRRARRAPRHHQPRRRILRARVPLRRRGKRRRRAGGRADRGPPPDRAADDPHQRAGRPVAGA